MNKAAKVGLQKLGTEQANAVTAELDTRSAREIAEIIQGEGAKVAAAVAGCPRTCPEGHRPMSLRRDSSAGRDRLGRKFAAIPDRMEPASTWEFGEVPFLMEKFVIRGGNPLVGTVRISGAKNAALPAMANWAMAARTIAPPSAAATWRIPRPRTNW